MSQHFKPDIVQANYATVWGDYSLGDVEEFASKQLAALAKALPQGTLEEQEVFSNATFRLHDLKHYLNECSCGFEEQQNAWHDANEHKDSCIGVRYNAEHAATVARGANSQQIRQHMQGWSLSATNREHDDCSTMCDCGEKEAHGEWAKSHSHTQDCRLIMPNFTCDDLQIYWFRHPTGPKMSCNRPTSREELTVIFDRCMESIS